MVAEVDWVAARDKILGPPVDWIAARDKILGPTPVDQPIPQATPSASLFHQTPVPSVQPIVSQDQFNAPVGTVVERPWKDGAEKVRRWKRYSIPQPERQPASDEEFKQWLKPFILTSDLPPEFEAQLRATDPEVWAIRQDYRAGKITEDQATSKLLPLTKLQPDAKQQAEVAAKLKTMTDEQLEELRLRAAGYQPIDEYHAREVQYWLGHARQLRKAGLAQDQRMHFGKIKRLPWIRYGVDVLRYTRIYNAIKAMDEDRATDQNYEDFADFIAWQEEQAGKGFWTKAGDIVLDLPAFFYEFGSTRFAYTGGKKAIEKVIKNRIAKWVLARAVGVGAHALANPQMIVAETLRRRIPEQKLAVDEEGKFASITFGDDPGFVKSLGQGYLDTYIELGTERMGSVFAKLPLANKVAGLKKAIVARWLAKGRTLPALTKLVQDVGWHGVVGELLEERAGEVARGATGLSEDYGATGSLGQWEGGWEQIAMEAAAFAIPAAGVTATHAIGGRGGPKISQTQQNRQKWLEANAPEVQKHLEWYAGKQEAAHGRAMSAVIAALDEPPSRSQWAEITGGQREKAPTAEERRTLWEAARRRLGMPIPKPRQKPQEKKNAGPIRSPEAEVREVPSGENLHRPGEEQVRPEQAGEVAPPQVAPTAEQKVKAPIPNAQRISDTYLKLAKAKGRSWNTRVRLADLRNELSDLPREEVDKALLALEREEKAVLFRADNPVELKPEDQAAILKNSAGFARHYVYMEGPVGEAAPKAPEKPAEAKPTPKPTPITEAAPGAVQAKEGAKAPTGEAGVHAAVTAATPRILPIDKRFGKRAPESLEEQARDLGRIDTSIFDPVVLKPEIARAVGLPHNEVLRHLVPAVQKVQELGKRGDKYAAREMTGKFGPIADMEADKERAVRYGEALGRLTPEQIRQLETIGIEDKQKAFEAAAEFYQQDVPKIIDAYIDWAKGLVGEAVPGAVQAKEKITGRKQPAPPAERTIEARQSPPIEPIETAVEEARAAIADMDVSTEADEFKAMEKVARIAKKHGVDPNEVWRDSFWEAVPRDITKRKKGRKAKPVPLSEAPTIPLDTKEAIRDAYQGGEINAEQALTALSALKAKIGRKPTAEKKPKEEKAPDDAWISVSPAKYAKNSVAVQTKPIQGFKSRASRLAEAIKGRYSHREKAYIMSKPKAKRLQKLLDEGWDASATTKELIPPVSEAPAPEGKETGKQPWEMTKAEYVRRNPKTADPNVSPAFVHRHIVTQAFAEGKPVPPEVLADYPDLVSPAPTAEAAQRRAEEARPKTIARAMGPGGGAGTSERIREDDIPDAIKAPKEQERRFQKARGMRKPSLMQRIKEIVRTLRGVTRAQEHIPNTAEFAPANEFFRLLRNVQAMAQDEVIRTTAAIVDPLGPKQLMLFERYTIMENLAASLEVGQPLRFGFKSADDVEVYRSQLQDVVDRVPEVQEAIKTRRKIVKETVDKLIEYGLLPETARDNTDTYYHQQVHFYMMAQGVGRGSRRVGKIGRSFQKRRVVGEELAEEQMDYNTSYLESEISWMTDAQVEIEKERLLRQLMDKYDEKPQLKERAKRQNFENVVGGPKVAARIDQILGELRESRESEDAQDSAERMRRKQLIEELEDIDPTHPYRRQIAKMANWFRREQGIQEDEEFEDDSAFWKLVKDQADKGSIPALAFFKALHQREDFIRQTLGKRYVTWQSLAEETEGMDVFQPEPGNQFYRAFTIPEQIVEQLQAEVLDTADLTKDDLRQVLAMAGPRRQFVVPTEIALQLKATRKGEAPHGLSRVADEMMRTWKVYTLLNPKRAVAYNLRNWTGDIDPVIAADPRLLRHLDLAMAELSRYYKGHLQLSPKLRAARDHGVIGSGFASQEVPDIKDLAIFRRFISQSGKAKLPLRPIKGYMEIVKPLTQWREDVLRYAAFLAYRQQLQQGTVKHYGASKKAVVQQIKRDLGVDAAAAHMARNLLGDYGNISVAGNWIRRRLMPFWSFQEINLKRVPRLLVNAWESGGTWRTAGTLSAAAGRAILMSRIAWLYGALWIWNHLIQGGDEEDELAGYDRAGPHLILGRNADGSIRVFRRVGALGEFLEWFGVNEAVAMLHKREAGQVETSDIIKEMAFATPEKTMNALRPDLKALYEIPTGQSLFPEPFQPRSVRRGEAVSHIFGLQDEYQWMKGKILGDGSTVRPHYWQRWFVGIVDPRDSALSQTYDLRTDFLKEKGKEDKGVYPVSRYKEARDAAKFEDYDAFVDWKRKFVEEKGEGAKEDFQRWLGTLDPLGQRLSDPDELEFANEFLSNEQRQRLAVARNYAGELRDLLVTWWDADERSKEMRTSIAFSAFRRMDTSEPKRKDYSSDAKFQEAQASFKVGNERAAKDIKAMVPTYEEAYQLLRDYYEMPDQKGKKGSIYNKATKRTGDLKPSFRARKKALRELYP